MSTVDDQIAKRRNDTEFMCRLAQRVEQDRPLLDKLAKDDGPVNRTGIVGEACGRGICALHGGHEGPCEL